MVAREGQKNEMKKKKLDSTMFPVFHYARLSLLTVFGAFCASPLSSYFPRSASFPDAMEGPSRTAPAPEIPVVCL